LKEQTIQLELSAKSTKIVRPFLKHDELKTFVECLKTKKKALEERFWQLSLLQYGAEAPEENRKEESHQKMEKLVKEAKEA